MSIEILPCILNEDDVGVVSDTVLKAIADCSTEVIKTKIKKYLDNPNANVNIQERIRNAYSEDMNLQEYLSAEKTKDVVEMLETVDYSSITANTSSDLLNKYIEGINYVLDSKYATPYLMTVVKSNYEDLVIILKEEMHNSADEVKGVYAMLISKFDRYKNLFYVKGKVVHKGTVVKRIVRDERKYMAIRRGCAFIINKRKQNCLPSSWRYL